MIPMSGGTNAAASSLKRAKRTAKPKKGLNPHQSVMLTVMPDGSFRCADIASRRLCKDRGLKSGDKLLSYMYVPRDENQWGRVHQVGTFLTLNHDDFDGLDSHGAIKKIQLDSGFGCEFEEQVIDLGALGKHTIMVRRAKSFAWGWMDDSEFEGIWKSMCGYIRNTYFGVIEADAVEQMDRLMAWEQAA